METKDAVLNVLDLIDQQNKLNAAIATALNYISDELDGLAKRVAGLERRFDDLPREMARHRSRSLRIEP